MRLLPTMAIAVGAAALSPSTAVHAEVKQIGENAFVTRDMVTVAASQRAVWLALSKPADWWSDTHSWSGDAANLTLTPQAGGCFCETIPAVEDGDMVGLAGSARHMVVINAVPDKVLRMRGGLGPLQSEPAEGVLTITLSPDDDGTQIVFEYIVGGFTRFKTPVIAKAVDAVMSEQLAGLAALLDPKAAAAKAAAAKPVTLDADNTASDIEDAGDDVTEPEPEADNKPKAGARPTVGDTFGDID